MVYVTQLEATTDSGAKRPVFYNNTGFDIVITNAYITGIKGADASNYMTPVLTDQDANTIASAAWTAVSTGTTFTTLGTCSATHGVIPDAEYVYLQFDQTLNGDSAEDVCLLLNYKFQTPSD